MFGKIKYLIILLYSYRKILITVIIFELYYSIKNLELIPITKVHNSNFGTDTIPCVYYFLFINFENLFSKFITSGPSEEIHESFMAFVTLLISSFVTLGIFTG